MHDVFKSPELQAQFEHDGFVVLPCLGQEEVDALTRAYDGLPTIPQTGFFTGIYSESRAFKQGANELLVSIGRDFAATYLSDYTMLVGSFVLKMPGKDSTMPCHQDWTFVDEHRYASINVWCALTDTNHENGAMYVLPGSHRLDHNIRGTLIPGSLGLTGDIPCEEMLCVPIRAGQAIIHDHRLLHRSPPNLSARRRLATALCMIPAEAKAMHYALDPASGKLRTYGIGTEFFFDYTFGKNAIPSGATLVKETDRYDQVHFAKDSARRLMAAWKARGRATSPATSPA